MLMHELDVMEDVLHSAIVELQNVIKRPGTITIKKREARKVAESLHLVCACLAANPFVLLFFVFWL